jgi:ketosteroid isomerase-like protein
MTPMVMASLMFSIFVAVNRDRLTAVFAAHSVTINNQSKSRRNFMKFKRDKRLLLVLLGVGLITLLFAAAKVSLVTGRSLADTGALTTDALRINHLIEEMEAIDSATLAAMPAIPMEPFVLPDPGVDVMRVQLEETYEVDGIGKDTVPLTGWIAVKHFNTRAADGEKDIRWETAITDTEFVAMDLRGESKIFGPVQVRLDKRHQLLGRVGKLNLPFAVQTSLDAAYRGYRKQNNLIAASSPKKRGKAPVRQDPSSSNTLSTNLTLEQAAVYQTLQSVMTAVSNKDADTMAKYYATGPDTLFFGNFGVDPQKSEIGGDIEVARRAKMFSFIKTIQVVPDQSMRITVSGSTAIAALTGVNNVVSNAGFSGSRPWRWSIELRKDPDKWVIVHDHLSFYQDPNAPIENNSTQNFETNACNCLASVSVEILMPKFNLQMVTKTPVTWYSEVETIPPVGYTASICLTPSQLVSDGRVIATLTSGAVKFREVVRHITLNGG